MKHRSFRGGLPGLPNVRSKARPVRAFYMGMHTHRSYTPSLALPTNGKRCTF